jgi:hypothetical protein
LTPAIGFRIWRIDELLTGPRLVSPFRHVLWPPGTQLEAECWTDTADSEKGQLPKAHRREPDLRPPLEACTCGIYAYHSIEEITKSPMPRHIGGAVLCWGRITIHREGIRSQFARPLALGSAELPLESSTEADLLQLAASYGIPLLDVSHLALYAREFGECYDPIDAVHPTWGSRITRSMRDVFAGWFGA